MFRKALGSQVQAAETFGASSLRLACGELWAARATNPSTHQRRLKTRTALGVTGRYERKGDVAAAANAQAAATQE